MSFIRYIIHTSKACLYIMTQTMVFLKYLGLYLLRILRLNVALCDVIPRNSLRRKVFLTTFPWYDSSYSQSIFGLRRTPKLFFCFLLFLLFFGNNSRNNKHGLQPTPFCSVNDCILFCSAKNKSLLNKEPSNQTAESASTFNIK